MKNVDETAKKLEKHLGIPFFGKFRIKIGLANAGRVQIELT